MDESVNIQALIDSGDLELFVLGALPDAEMRKITSLSAAHPELLTEIETIEAAMMQLGESQSEYDPGMSVLEGALAAIDEEEKKEAAVVPLQPVEAESTSKSSAFQPIWAWAAAIALLIGSGILNLYFYQDLNDSQLELLALRSEQQVLAQNFDRASFDLQESQDRIVILQSPATRRIDLNGVPGKENSRVTVFWEPNEAAVLLTSASLPQAPEGFQYQLWAIVDGDPVDAGLLEGLEGWQNMKAISGNAAAFAITLEPEGGSISPTLEEMVVIGNV